MEEECPQDLPSWCALIGHTTVVIVSAVMYAPDVGRLGLDMARKVTRTGEWQQVKKTEPVSNINSGAPWYPECGGYAVCCISDGMW